MTTGPTPMLLSVLITKDELTTFLSAVTPLRIVMDEQRGRCLVLGRPQLELVPNEGIRLRGDARLTWDLVGLAIPVTIQAWQLMLRPRIATRGRANVLVFVPVLE